MTWLSSIILNSQHPKPKVDYSSIDMNLSFGILITSSIIIPVKAIANFISIRYISTDFKVSDHVKRILISEASSILFWSVIEFFGLCLIFLNGQGSFSCGLLFEPIGFGYLTICFHMMLLATVRFYMAERTGQNKAINDTKVQNYTVNSIAAFNLVLLILLSLSFGLDFNITPLKSYCSGEKAQFDFDIHVFAFLFFPCTLANFYFDIKLVNFVNDFNLRHPNVMVIWSNEMEKINQNKENKTVTLEKQLENLIPRLSSFLTFGMFAFTLIIVIIVSFNVEHEYILKEFIGVLIWIIKAVHLPAVLIMTVWAQSRKKRRKIVNLPTGLQFHGDEPETELKLEVPTSRKNSGKNSGATSGTTSGPELTRVESFMAEDRCNSEMSSKQIYSLELHNKTGKLDSIRSLQTSGTNSGTTSGTTSGATSCPTSRPELTHVESFMAEDGCNPKMSSKQIYSLELHDNTGTSDFIRTLQIIHDSLDEDEEKCRKINDFPIF